MTEEELMAHHTDDDVMKDLLLGLSLLLAKLAGEFIRRSVKRA